MIFVNLRRELLAELFGTFALVFAGTGAIVVNEVHGGTITHVGIALTFGLVVMALIYTLGDISGCHLNPAVSAGLCLAGRFSANSLAPYVTAQLTGAVLASGLLGAMYPQNLNLGGTRPAGGDIYNAFIMEVVLTFILMVAILGATIGNHYKTHFAGIAIGGVIALEAMFGGPVSGASMNPARSFGPDAVAFKWDYLWIYLSAPFAGAIAGVLFWKLVETPTAAPPENKE